MSETLYIVMPTYNEETNIREVVKDWYPMLEYGSDDSRLVIADGGSVDNTLNVLYKLKNTYPKLEVFSQPGTDHGTKVIWLYKYAIKKKANWIFQTDTDGQTKASEFIDFWEFRNNYEAIIGDRVVRGDGAFRKFVEIVLCVLCYIFFGVKIKDSNAPFRLQKTELLNKYIYNLDDKFQLPNTMMTSYYVYYKHRILFKEITFQPRQGGKNYINFKRIVNIGIKTFFDFIRLKKTFV